MKCSLAMICFLGTCVLPMTAAAQSSRRVPGTRPRNLGGSTTLTGTSLSPIYSATGLVSLSIDAFGTTSSSGLIQVDKPAGATVRAAFLMSASTGFCFCSIPNGDVALAGVPITWDQSIGNAINSTNHLADVTAIVAPIVDAASPGIVDLTVDETNSAVIDGSILAVVFDNPNLTQIFTAAILFGAQNIAGDDFSITLIDPAQPADPAYTLDLSLGISYGYQIPSSADQFSLVDVNGIRMTSSAGGQDDDQTADGALITAGGIGDDHANPADPNAPPVNCRDDDELYDLKPFVNTGDTLIAIHTVNPSNDDNILFAGLLVSGAAVVGEGASLTPVSATNPVGTTHTVTATLHTSAGVPLVGKQVDFEITTGPHAGTTANDVSDVNGEARFTYTGIAEGVERIQATFVSSQNFTVYSNPVTKTWIYSYVPFCFGDGTLVNCPCSNNGSPGNGCGNSDHPGGANLTATGDSSLGSDSLVMIVTDQHPGSLSLFFQGDHELASTGSFGDGLRCAGGIIKRLYYIRNAHSSSASAPSPTSLPSGISVSAQSAAKGDVLSYGSQRLYQVLYRDANPTFCPLPTGNNFNATNALRITWGL